MVTIIFHYILTFVSNSHFSNNLNDGEMIISHLMFERHTGKVGPGTWDPPPGAHRQDPGPGTFTWDPAPGTLHLGPGTWTPKCGTLIYRNQSIDLLRLVFI